MSERDDDIAGNVLRQCAAQTNPFAPRPVAGFDAVLTHYQAWLWGIGGHCGRVAGARWCGWREWHDVCPRLVIVRRWES